MSHTGKPVPAQSAFRLGTSIASLAAQAERRQRYVRVARATVFLLVLLAIGTYGYYWLTDGDENVIDCLYMTVITVSTVGFQEVIPATSDALKIWTMSLILLGGGSLLYFLTTLAAIVVEGDLLYGFWRRRTMAKLRQQYRHIVVAGLGHTGSHAAAELWASRASLVAVDINASKVESLLARFGETLLFIIGDALDERTLQTAQIEQARGLLAVLPDDRDNLLLCLTARQLNPALRIVAKLVDPSNASKFFEVGVDAVVDPSSLGGQRLANELVRPELLVFSDGVLAAEGHKRTLAAVPIHEEAEVVSQTLRDVRLEDRTGCLIMGLRYSPEGPFRYHAAPDSVLVGGGAVMALGDRRQLSALRRILSKPPTRRRRRELRRDSPTEEPA